MTKINFILHLQWLLGPFPPCSPPSPKEMPFNQTAPCWRGLPALQLALHLKLRPGWSSAFSGLQEPLGQSEGGAPDFAVDMRVWPRRTLAQMLSKPQAN